MEENKKLPFRAEYAKSGRAGCKTCKEPIAKDSLRLAVMVQSPFFDGMQPNWHHEFCFFKKFRPKDVADISHFESLRWNDQEYIRKKIENPGEIQASSSGKSKSSKSKKRKNEETNGVPDLADYTVGYAKSGKSKCKVCEEFISKNEIRISKKDYENEIALRYGPTERWHHVECFLKAREELGFCESAAILPGFKTLEPEDQKTLKAKIPKIEITKPDTTDGPSPPKKSKDEIPKDEMRKQNQTMFKYRDKLEVLTKQEMVSLFEFNNQDIPEGSSRMLDRLSDAMAFGALKRCKLCSGQLTFRTGIGYQCLGHVSEWTRCQEVYAKPERVSFKVPEELKESYSFLKKYKGVVSERLFIPSTSPNKPAENKEMKREKSKPLLKSLKVCIHKTESKTSAELKKQIENLGGSVVKSLDKDVVAVVSTNAEIQKIKLAKVLKSAKESEIHVVPETFLDEVSGSSSRAELIEKLNEKKISSWGCDLSSRIEETNEKESAHRSKSIYPSKSEMFKSNDNVKTITVKDGLAVDPDSELEQIAHVYRYKDDIYSVVLSLTDVQTGRNSYYRMQILEGDKKNKYWLFRAWGRIGTTIGGNKTEKYQTLNDAQTVFKTIFEEKTGNAWETRKHFKKVPGKMMMLDIQNGDQGKDEEKPKAKLESKILSKPVQDLMTLIFDIEAMKKTMLEFELDLNKMPLGKLSQKQISKGFEILSELQNAINAAADGSASSGGKHIIIEKTNMFYTLVPHDTGIKVPPLLDNDDIIRQKIDMLNSLMDIEIAYKMLQECENSENTIDDHYKKLNAKITDLDPSSEEFSIIEKYVKNTHAKTHMNYSLEIENVFKVERKEENKRFKKFSKFPNRKLLWHGSRITNFAGILSQGLRVAPPEAPVTGYMFGKGIYFADMVSKSANYCNTSKKNPTGLLLLCEVALGEMHELTKADYITKLPPGKHSVKGVGKTHPDPTETATTPTGAQIPLGKGIDAQIKNSSLLYNEYIVYDIAQVKIQYLLRLKFNHKV